MRVAFIGRLVPYKGADMLLEAAAPLVRAGQLEIDVLGDGPEMGSLQEMRAELELGDGVRLDGWVPHAELSGRLLACDVLGFPSVREFGGGVVLEAMAVGLCPVVAAYGGPGELVTPETGYRIPMGSRSEIVARLREILTEIVADPAEARRRGDRARIRAHSQFSWSAKAAQVRQVYDWVTGRRATKPDPGLDRFVPPAGA